ncbi:hypothetical protein LCGC14_2811180 [marine sediment metagenome]|uniref:Uncharacterized protein n=1 Tax=marine sediment metagenome TaxID=412755 RepID=A0A0F8YJS9_9ZZZZ|nr:hypothetical protein [Pricia sp.]
MGFTNGEKIERERSCVMPKPWMTTKEYFAQEPCGSIHPNHPYLVCDKHGECAQDWHSTAYRDPRDNWTSIFQWGKYLEEFLRRHGGPVTGIVMKITEISDDKR